MGAPAKSTGGVQSAKDAPGRRTRGSGRPEATSVKLIAESGNNLTLDEAGSVPRDTKSNDGAPHISRAEAIRAKTPKRGRSGSAEPPRYSNRSTRPRIIEAARKTAAEHGYDRLRLKHITDEAGISHQAFYGHFANKRHAVAAATSDDLGAVADLANRGSRRDEEWAERMLADIDKTLVATYPATDGPEKWLRDRITEAVSTDGGFSALRIIELIRVSKLGHGEFYRRYGGKRGCLQRIYGEALGEVKAEVGEELSVDAIARSFASDRRRTELLILGAPHLPEGGEKVDDDGATQTSLLDLLRGLITSSGERDDRYALVVAGAILEVIRSAALEGSLEQLPERLRAFGPTAAREAEAPSLRLVA